MFFFTPNMVKEHDSVKNEHDFFIKSLFAPIKVRTFASVE